MEIPDARIEEDLTFYFEYHHRLSDFYAIAKYFYYPDTEEERSVTNADPFFLTTAYATWALVVVDLCKIFTASKSQKHNVSKLLSDIKTKPDYSTVLAKIGQPVIDQYIEKIRLKQSTIQKLNVLRDKHYAHVDDLKQNLNELKNPTFQETEELLDLLKELVIMLGEKMFDSQYDFPAVSEPDNFNPKAIVRDIVSQRVLKM